MKVNTKLAVILLCILLLAVGTFAGCEDNTTQLDYTITFDYQGATSGFAESTRKVTQDTAIGTLPSPAKVGFTFNGWFTQPSGQGTHILPENNTFDNDITLYAHFVQSAYRVVFVDFDGTVIKEEYIEEGGSATAPAVLINARLGYTFDGWDKPYSEITSNLTLTAQYTINLYIITLIGDPAVGGSVSGEGPYEYGSDVTVTASTDSDYTFDGWYNSAGTKVSGNASYSFAAVENVTLTAKWFVVYTPDEYFTFELINNGTEYNIRAKDTSNLPENLVLPKTYNGKPVTEIYSNSYSNGAFYKAAIKTVMIPEGYKVIGDRAFQHCNSLTSIKIPNSVNEIGGFAFYNCSSLTSIKIPISVTVIGDNVFSNCSSLASIEIPASVTSIGYGAFSDCISLTSIEIPNSVTSIDYYAFGGCVKLTSITLPFVGATLEGTSNTHFGYIFGANIYSNNDRAVPQSLKKVVLTGGKSIDYSAFSGCGITSIEIPDSVTSIGPYAFTYCGLTSIKIPDSVRDIGREAFAYCGNLTSIEISSGVSKIHDSTFLYCSSLMSVSFGENSELSSLSVSAFYSCSSLVSIEIPNGIAAIGDWAFQHCSILTSVTINATTPPKLGNYHDSSDVFYLTYSALKIYVPAASIDAYKSASDWGRHASRIFAIGEEVEHTPYEYFAFELINNNTEYSIRAKDASSLPEDLVLPKTYNGKPVTEIYSGDFGSGAFLNAAIISVIIPEGYKVIGYAAFFDCGSLTSIYIPASVSDIGGYAFYNCSYLKSVVFGENSQLTSIGNAAFRYCIRLMNVMFGENSQLASIDDRAFANCYNLININIPASVTYIGDYAFYNCYNFISINIPASVSYIGDWAFSYCGSLTNINIPASVSYIGDWAFSYCGSLTNINIPASASYIGDWAFSDCDRLTSVTFAGNSQLAHIGNNAFSNCSSLTYIEIPSSVTSIGGYAFSNCSRLTSIDIPSSVTSIGNGAFSNCNSLVSINIPSSVTSIGDYAFSYCSSLTSINIPASVTSIGDFAFRYCGRLMNVMFGENSQLASIGQNAFYNCASLIIINIPANVTYIGSYAFSYCYILTSVTIHATAPPTLVGISVFSLAHSTLTIYVPADSVDAYKAAAVWSSYASRIYPMP